MSEVLEVKSLRKVLQRFNEDLGQYINGEERYKLGRVLTIIDASIADPEQRKAIKDLINNEWWSGNGIRPSTSDMANPHSDLRAICELFGFELYESTSTELPVDDLGYLTKRYRKFLAE